MGTRERPDQHRRRLVRIGKWMIAVDRDASDPPS
jgi:hypothetical protein